jgi:hypothetical protein
MKTKSTHISARAGLLAAALLGLSTLAHAANMPDGTYEGTLSCGAGQATDIGPAFTAPTRITVSGNKLTWSRQTASMKEVVSGSLVEGKAILEGYARREREAALRERELALRANEKALAAPTNVAEAPTAAAPLPTPKALVEPVNAQVVSSPSPVVAAAPAVLDVPTPAESEAKVEVIPAVPTRLTNRVAVSRVEEPAKAKPVSAPGTGTPQKFSNGTSDVLLTSAVIAMLLALAAIGWKLYPRYFQSRSEHYYSSPWERLKKRSGFVATFCFFSVMAIAAVVSILRGA